MIFTNKNNVKYTILNKLSSGGEGAVYTLVGNDSSVVKIYHDNYFDTHDRIKHEKKITTMLNKKFDYTMGTGQPVVAWPTDILYGDKGQFVGFVMPKINKDYKLFDACRQNSREKMFGKTYNWKMGVIIAYNLSSILRYMHKNEIIVGDFNTNNILINSKGHISFIDCDSFTITDGCNTYKTQVGFAEVIPPELQGKDLGSDNARFTQASDNFALAIHIFNLLMNNIHPFGVPNSIGSSVANPIVTNIAQGYCPYVKGQSGSKYAPDFDMLPPKLQALFRRAFDYDVKTALLPQTIAKRPTALEWKEALKEVYNTTLVRCSVQPDKHTYPSHYKKGCPWCNLAGGGSFFKNNSNVSGASIVTITPIGAPKYLLIILLSTGVLTGFLLRCQALDMLTRFEIADITAATCCACLSGALAGLWACKHTKNKYLDNSFQYVLQGVFWTVLRTPVVFLLGVVAVWILLFVLSLLMMWFVISTLGAIFGG